MSLAPINDSYLSGRPFYCALCGAGYGEFIACEEPDCKLESAEEAQARLARARTQETNNGREFAPALSPLNEGSADV